MTYKFNKEQHTAKIKAGLEQSKKKGKKLGRPKDGKIKGEDAVIDLYTNHCVITDVPEVKFYLKMHKDARFPVSDYKISTRKPFYQEMAEHIGVSKSTVQKIINKYKGELAK